MLGFWVRIGFFSGFHPDYQLVLLVGDGCGPIIQFCVVTRSKGGPITAYFIGLFCDWFTMTRQGGFIICNDSKKILKTIKVGFNKYIYLMAVTTATSTVTYKYMCRKVYQIFFSPLQLHS